MPNTYQPWQVFTNEAMRILKNKLVFLKGVNRDNQHLFAKPGMKSGQQINVRLPARFVGRVGEGYEPEGYAQTSFPVNVRPLQGVDIDVPSTEWTLNIDDVKRDILNPAMSQLVNNIERDCLQMAYRGVANFVGVPGVAPTTSTTVLQANAFITNEGGPDDDTRKMLLSPNTNVSLVPAFQGLFNPQNKVSTQFERGLIGKNTLGFDHYQTQNLWQHQIGPLGGAPTVNAAGQSGTSIVTNNWTAAVGLRLRQGDVIQFASTNAVNPMTRALYGGLRNCVVTADVYSDGAGNATIPISVGGPGGLIAAPAQFATVDALPAAGALISVFGVAAAGQAALANTYTTQCMGYHRDAFTFAGISQEIPKGSTEMAYEATDPETGVQLRFLRQYSGKDNLFINRFDALYAFGVPYGQLGVRMCSN
jgi:hypothetical protein